jgi:hypothetical protein
MAKKPNTESDSTKKMDVKPISFELPYYAPFYILEVSNEENYFVFNTLEGAVGYIDGLEGIETDDMKLLGFNRDKEQFSVSQISWAKIYQISRDLRKSGG